MNYYLKKQIADLIGIRCDTFKKNIQKGLYSHLIGPIKRDEKGRRLFTQEQLNKLLEWYKGNDVKLRCISMGGGIQSTSMLLMHFQKQWDPQPDCAMFIDLDWESQSTYENLKRLEELCRIKGFPFYWIKGHKIHKDLLNAAKDPNFIIKSPPFFLRNKQGSKGQLTRQCTAHYKIKFMETKLRELFHVPTGKRMRYRVEVWIGITTDEVRRINNNLSSSWLIKRFPLIEKNFSRQDCINWLMKYNYPIPPKSACLGCPYRPNTDWLEMKKKRPGEWQSVVEVDRAIRSGINKVRVPLYIHQSLQPLESIKFEGPL